jgi:esterase/lipase superfamily enzyme
VKALRAAGLAALFAFATLAGCASVAPPAPQPVAAAAAAPEPAWPAWENQLPPPRMRAVAPKETCPPAFSGTCYPVWFGTNRKPLDAADPARGFGPDYDDTLRYGKRVLHIPASHRPGELGSPLWKRLLTGADDRIRLAAGLSLDEAAFRREVQGVLARLEPADRQVLVYIHGFNTSFDDAALRAAQLGHDLQVPGLTMFFSWPSRGQVGAYLTDLGSIEASEEQLAEFLVQATRLAGPGKVHVIAHSMGNRGLLRALHRATAQAALRSGTRFGQIFLAAPDVDVKLFRQLADVYPQVSDHTTLYVADQDKALAALEWIAEGLRAGGAPPLLVMRGIDTVHVHGGGLFRLGHSYVAEEPAVLRDIRAQLYWGDTPQQRRKRYGWPVPHEDPQGRGAWRIGR